MAACHVGYMSEYQYYEFQAIDRPLTENEMAELRSFSTRARITPMSFVNEYNWGNFKGNPDMWMERYFDAFLYLANWGTHVLKLRLPSGLLDLQTARKYYSSDSAFVHEKNGKVVLSFVSEDEDAEWVEDDGSLAALISVRSDLKRGDMRALYLGWLLCAQGGELDDEDEEPPVPPGLGQLSASLDSFIEFLRIDRDLIHVAAQASAPLEDMTLKIDEVKTWVARLPAEEKDDALARLMVDGDQPLVSKLLQRYLKGYDHPGERANDTAARRTVGDLLRAAKEYAEERRRMEAEKRAREKAQREREAAIARAKYLNKAEGHEPQLWAEVDALIASRKSKSYDQAVKLLIDLRDLDARRKGGNFRLRIEEIRRQHVHKPSFIKRLRKAML
jgi:hypothetical protein